MYINQTNYYTHILPDKPIWPQWYLSCYHQHIIRWYNDFHLCLCLHCIYQMGFVQKLGSQMWFKTYRTITNWSISFFRIYSKIFCIGISFSIHYQIWLVFGINPAHNIQKSPLVVEYFCVKICPGYVKKIYGYLFAWTKDEWH